MKQSHLRRLFSGALLLGACAISMAAPVPTPSPKVKFDYYKLPNGLKVVLSQDSSAPTVAVGVYFKIGFRV
jgi:zinc protease